MCARGAPLSGLRTSTVVPLVASSRRVRLSAYSGSRAYDAVASCSGSRGPSTSGPPAGLGFRSLMRPSLGRRDVGYYRRVAAVALYTVDSDVKRTDRGRARPPHFSG